MKQLLLLPISWIYGIVVGIRNQLFNMGVLKSASYDVPVISVGNITVGGTGKTPHVEYLIRLLRQHCHVAVLSRGYKRKSKGYQLADDNSTAADIGDEPLQMKRKYADITVAVCADRRQGIDHLMHDEATSNTDVILLDDAYQHRWVKPGINILLVDHQRLLHTDHMLPYGRMRERKEESKRADIIVITKCPTTMKPMDFRLLRDNLGVYPYQTLLFSTMSYQALRPMYCGNDIHLHDLDTDTSVLLIAGIAQPQRMADDLQPHFHRPITLKSYPDHHAFTPRDIADINAAYAALPEPRVAITTEKDAARLFGQKGFDDDLRHHFYMAPIEVQFLLDEAETFNAKILSYVEKNSKNSILVQQKPPLPAEKEKKKGNNTISVRKDLVP